MNKTTPPKSRHQLTPADFAKEFGDGVPNIHSLIEDLGRQATVEASSSLAIMKKTLGLMLIMKNQMELMEKEINLLKSR